MKKTNKKNDYSYIVDLRNIETLEDIAPVWALAKHKAGLVLTDDDLTEICLYMSKLILPKTIIVTVCDCCEKKLPWYKRFWNWMTKPFKKNK